MPQDEQNGNGDTDDKIVRAIAKFTFSGRNNDELSFEKNDIIIVTQMLDGGWWEGNLNNKIGWFPSDFVGIIKESSQESTANLADSLPTKDIERVQAGNRAAIVSGFKESESQHIVQMKRVNDEFLKPLRAESILTDDENRVLSANLSDIISLATALYSAFEAQAEQEVSQQRIGGAFLDAAPQMKELLTDYCLNHPNAVDLFNAKKDILNDFFENRQLAVNDLISGLSLAFRHVEKYAPMLQELERNYPDSHADRGNLQRGSAVYRSIWHHCLHMRRQKEIQIEFLSQDYLATWFGKNYKTILGEMVYLGGVTVGNPRESVMGRLADRKIVLFSKMILLLESTSKGECLLKEKFATNELTVNKDESQRTLEFRNGPNVLATVSSLTSEDFHQLIDALTSCANVSFNDAALLHQISPASPQKLEPTDLHQITDVSPLKRAEIHQLPQAQQPQLAKKSSFGDLDEMNPVLQALFGDAAGPSAHRREKLYSGYTLRPYPAPRGGCPESGGKIKLRKGVSADEHEDAMLLRLIEGYHSLGQQAPGIVRSDASTSGIKRTQSYADDQRPQLIVAEDEKILVEEQEGDAIVYRERTLVDTVYSLKDQVGTLTKELNAMRQLFEKEQRARRRLEDSLRRSSQQISLSSTPKPSETELQ